MTIKIISTRNYSSDGVKVLISGPAGIGKTMLSATAPNPIIISAEAGLLSLANYDIPVIEVTSIELLMDAYRFCTESKEARMFETYCLDSISEIGEVLLSQYKKDYKDPRQAYGETNDSMTSLIRSFRDIKGKHVYFTAKQSRIDENGRICYVASMPGKTLVSALPYFFDEVFVMGVGKLEDGETYRYLQTTKDALNRDCKDRSGKLSDIEKPDLSYIFDKISNYEDDEIVEEKAEEAEEQEEEEEQEEVVEKPLTKHDFPQDDIPF